MSKIRVRQKHNARGFWQVVKPGSVMMVGSKEEAIKIAQASRRVIRKKSARDRWLL